MVISKSMLFVAGCIEISINGVFKVLTLLGLNRVIRSVIVTYVGLPIFQRLQHKNYDRNQSRHKSPFGAFPSLRGILSIFPGAFRCCRARESSERARGRARNGRAKPKNSVYLFGALAVSKVCTLS